MCKIAKLELQGACLVRQVAVLKVSENRGLATYTIGNQGQSDHGVLVHTCSIQTHLRSIVVLESRLY